MRTNDFATAPPDEAWADLNKRAGARVKQLRIAAGIGPSDLASRLREGWHIDTWHRATVARVEEGSRPLRLDEAHALAGIFGVQMHDLLEGTEDLDLAALELQKQDAETEIARRQNANADRLAQIHELDREIRQAGREIDNYAAVVRSLEQRIANINDGETEEDLADAGNGYEEI